MILAVAFGCGSREPDEVRVFAASSLTGVMETIARNFEVETGTKVRLNLAASSTLARQIVEGAPCDVFLSADEEWADFVERAGMVVSGSRRVLLTNSLVVVAPESAGLGGTWVPSGPGVNLRLDFGRSSFLRAPEVHTIAMGNPEHVPAGRYGRAWLRRDWEAIESKVVPCESVRAALALVERGEVDAGVVYRTDALASVKVSTVIRPSPPMAAYPLMEIRGGSPVSCRFTYHLGSPAARAVFEKAGFGFPDPR